MDFFEWDEKKRLATFAKHKIDFLDAIEIFGGPVLILLGRSEIESRQRAVAPWNGAIICVVFTMRDEVTRIITARVARQNEREQYQALYAGRNPGDEGSD